MLACTAIPCAEVIGLGQVSPWKNWPPVVTVHVAFQIMVAIGSVLALLGVVYCLFVRRNAFPRWFLWSLVGCGPLGMVAIEAGWVVTEVGRQPRIISGMMRTKDAVTPVPGMVYHFYLFLGLYLRPRVAATVSAASLGGCERPNKNSEA